MSLPNYDRVQHASVRAKVDPAYYEPQQQLDEAWYGDRAQNGRSDRATGAKVGVRGRIWRGIEIVSEVQFNRLSGLIEARRVVALVDQNVADGNPYPDLLDFQEVGRNPDDTPILVTRRDSAQSFIDAGKAMGNDIDDILARGP